MRTGTVLLALVALYAAASIGLARTPERWYPTPDACWSLNQGQDSTATADQHAQCDAAADLAEDRARAAYGLGDGE